MGCSSCEGKLSSEKFRITFFFLSEKYLLLASLRTQQELGVRHSAVVQYLPFLKCFTALSSSFPRILCPSPSWTTTLTECLLCLRSVFLCESVSQHLCAFNQHAQQVPGHLDHPSVQLAHGLSLFDHHCRTIQIAIEWNGEVLPIVLYSWRSLNISLLNNLCELVANTRAGNSICEDQDGEAFWGRDVTGRELVQEKVLRVLLPRYCTFAAFESVVNEPCVAPAREAWLGSLVSVCVSGTWHCSDLDTLEDDHSYFRGSWSSVSHDLVVPFPSSDPRRGHVLCLMWTAFRHVLTHSAYHHDMVGFFRSVLQSPGFSWDRVNFLPSGCFVPDVVWNECQ